MDFLLASASSALVDASSVHEGARGGVSAKTGRADGSHSTDPSFLDCLLGSTGQEETRFSQSTAPTEGLPPVPGTPLPLLGFPEKAVQADSSDSTPEVLLEEPAAVEDFQGSTLQGVSEEPATGNGSEEPMVRGSFQRAAGPWNPQAPGPAATGRPQAETRPDPGAEETFQLSKESRFEEKGPGKHAVTWEQHMGPLLARTGASSPVPTPAGTEQYALMSDKGAQCGEAVNEEAEGVCLPKEAGRAKAEALDVDPRTLLSRMEPMKGAEERTEWHPGEFKSPGRTSPAEPAALWSAREGVSLKHEFPIDVASRPAPSQAPSTHGLSFHPPQVEPNGAFRVFGNAVHMRIQDEELGPMRWHIHMNGGRITAEAVVETTRVQELLQNHQDVLAAKLNALGVEVEDFDVLVDQGSQEYPPFTGQKKVLQTGSPEEEIRSHNDAEGAGTKLPRSADRELDLYV